MNSVHRLVATFVACMSCAHAIAQGNANLLQVWHVVGPAVVKLTVTGTDASDAPKGPIYGTGVMVPPGVVVTALHVVGRDEDWKRQPDGAVLRYVEVTILDDQHYLPHSIGFAQVRVVPALDVAILTVTGEGFRTANLAETRPELLGTVIVMPWRPGKAQPSPVVVATTLTDQSRDGDVLTLVFPVIEGYSGTPVLNTNGDLVGIITNKLDEADSIAQPADLFKNSLPATATPPPRQVSSVLSGTLSYSYAFMVQGASCTGHLEKYDSHWTEYIPNDAQCNFRLIDYIPIGEDASWYYLFDPSRNMTDRLPKGNGNLQWAMNRIGPQQASTVGWNPSYQVTKVQ